LNRTKAKALKHAKEEAAVAKEVEIEVNSELQESK